MEGAGGFSNIEYGKVLSIKHAPDSFSHRSTEKGNDFSGTGGMALSRLDDARVCPLSTGEGGRT
jgi:hypothetical protein